MASHRVDPSPPNFRRLSGSADLFGCGRRSGIGLRFRNSRHVISYAALFDIRVFSHIAFHHCFLIGSPFSLAILHNSLRALSVCFECCGRGGRGAGGGRWRAGFRKCTALQDCYPSKRATDQAKVLFHLSTPVGISLYREKALPNASRHLQPFQDK